ncbi:hypothetical protein OIU34_39215 [Pararhizobium sp. BT-229]|uniref:hypothetical protein n=1 Tax=Pararhizobium sp. BT-229 TaxID=2986923 RepID=UPI0021F6FFA2|nr:hypothetical protein [Pararhizobium sp. BT-229]MCV9967835.1 hypothetical protein [Pararhizobium sp. BT-229]
MSGCCGNPGVGKGDDVSGLPVPDYAVFNPGEVRLYGRPASKSIIPVIGDDDLAAAIKKIIEENAELKENFKNLEEGSKSVIDVTKKTEQWKNKYYFEKFFNQYIMLTAFNGAYFNVLHVDVNILSCGADPKYIKSIGVIYGYAFEGHCYKLPKPQIMYLPEEPKKILGGDCGCDCGFAPELGYAVWQIDKRKRVIALDIRSDDLQTLILDENMPGNRSPQAYAQSMSMAPQRSRE